MLPTSGLFKDIDCPYYDNYCGRPYCHFRHRKRNTDSAEDSQDGETATSEFPTYKPTPKSQLAQVKSHIPISYVPDTVLRPERLSRVPTTYNYTDKITYKPTPLSELSKNTAINTTAELMNKELLSNIEGNNKEEEPVTMNVEYMDEENCDIDFEELSTEFDMIDDIINECPSVVNEEYKESESNTIVEGQQEGPTLPSGTKSSKGHSSRDSHSKAKDDKSKHSKSGSSNSSANRHKSSHKSKTKSDHHRRSRSKEKDKEKSPDKPKDDKKRDKEHKKSSSSKDKRESDSSNSNKNHKHHKSSKDAKSSKSSGRSGSSSSKRKEIDKHKDKEKEKSKKDKRKKDESQKQPEKPQIETPKYTFSDEEDRDFADLFNEDLEEECYRIFNEYKPEARRETAVIEQSQYKPQGMVEEYVPTSKKRIAHMGAEQFVSKMNPVKLKPSQNPALQFTNRYKIAREAQMKEEDDIETVLSRHGSKRPILEAYKNLKKTKMTTDDGCSKVKKTMDQDKQQSTSLVDEIINGKSAAPLVYKPTPISKLNAEELKSNNKPLRIAPAMNASTMQQAKAKMIAEMAKKKELASKTPIQTLGKGNRRVAHIPDTSLGELPDVLQPESKKIPANVRTRYLTMIADECVKLYLSKEDAYNRAVNEEFKVMERCAAIVTYRNSAMLAVNRIRKELQDRETKGLGPISSGEPTTSNETNQFRGKRLYENITRYILKEDELEEHGYPREGPIAGKAVINKSQRQQLPRVNLDDNQRLCCRCFKVYLVDNRGLPLFTEDCIYHPLKKRTLRGERIYLCCKSTEDTGCVTSNTHVSESEESDLLGYQTTMEPERDDDPRSHSVYALDCEMCYTTKGLELTRVTIVDCDCKTVYESLVKPLNPIIDYNTTFSGITKEQMDRTSTSILQVQANILHLCNSDTILIGHSLESDMKALKIVHSRIIDTSIMFPHRLGLPHKRALRTLASEYLNKIIQSDVAGHDSAEDAITCMELVVWKLREDLKVKGIK